MRIVIIGSGNFGSALAKVFSQSHDILLIDKNKKLVAEINKEHTNNSYLPGIKFPKNVVATTKFAMIQKNDVLLLALPSQAVPGVCKALKKYYTQQIIIATSKGLSKEGLVTTEVIESILSCRPTNVLALSGPSIAKELASGKQALLALGGDKAKTRQVKSFLETDNLFLKTTTDKKGVQLLGFYKNIIALLVGLCDGLGLGNNFKASLITKAYNEFYALHAGKSIRRHSFVGPAGLGDLYVTTMSAHSRNRRFGYLIAQGCSAVMAQKKIGQTVEGYENILLLDGLKKKSCIDENLVRMLLAILHQHLQKDKVKSLLVKYVYAPDIKYIIFDWGNVLTKGYYSLQVASVLSEKYGMKKRELLKRLESEESNALRGVEPFKVFFLRVKKWYPQISYKDFLAAYKDSLTYNKELLSLCRSLKKDYRLFVVSNNYTVISPLLRHSILRDIFEGMVFSNEVHLVKPQKDIFSYALQKFQLQAESGLFIDDANKNVRAAEEVGMHAVQFKDITKIKKDLEKILMY
jgi:glycerol-3-phosphate dehydrogenase (NAD(P)+)